MNIVVTLQSITDIERLSEAGTDVFVIGNDEFANRLLSSFSNEEISQASTMIKALNKKLYINANLIVHNKDLDKMNEHLEFIKSLDVDGIIFGDIATYVLAKKLSIENLLIYNPETLNTNLYDPVFWNDKGIKGIVISKELTLIDILTITKSSPIETGIIGHGHLNMFHSRRPLIENYFKHADKEYDEYIENKSLRLVEEKRDEAYPVYQDKHGTHIFREKSTQSFNEIIELSESLNDFYIDGLFKDSEYLVGVVNDYKNIIKKNNLDFTKEISKKYQENHDTGFLYKKTVYDKY